MVFNCCDTQKRENQYGSLVKKLGTCKPYTQKGSWPAVEHRTSVCDVQGVRLGNVLAYSFFSKKKGEIQFKILMLLIINSDLCVTV